MQTGFRRRASERIMNEFCSTDMPRPRSRWYFVAAEFLICCFAPFAIHAQWTRVPLPPVDSTSQGLQRFAQSSTFTTIIYSGDDIYSPAPCSDLGWIRNPGLVTFHQVGDPSYYRTGTSTFAPDGRFYRLRLID